MQDAIARLRSIKERDGLSDRELAQRIGVTQPTVWRFLNGQIKPGRPGRARKLIVDFLNKDASSSARAVTAEAAPVLDALSRVWDGSAEQARGIARVLEALRGAKFRE